MDKSPRRARYGGGYRGGILLDTDTESMLGDKAAIAA